MVLKEPNKKNVENQSRQPHPTTSNSRFRDSDVESPMTPTTSYKRWPDIYKIPKNCFSTILMNSLKEQRTLSWSLRKEFKDHVVNDLQQYIGLRKNLAKIKLAAMATVEEFPYLKEEIGSGYGGWMNSITDRFKGLRTEVGDSSLEVRLSKRRNDMPGLDTEIKMKNARKGELNWQPDVPDGEDEASILRNMWIL